MAYYPIALRLEGRACVVIGGGEVAARKLDTLLAAGARVTVVAPELNERLVALADTHEIVHHARAYRSGDLSGAFLAIAATDDPTVQRAIAAEADQAHVLLNVVDVPALCTFIVPAVVQRGSVTVAVSTGGASPALARKLRETLSLHTLHIGDEYAVFADLLARLRARLAPNAKRREVFEQLIDSPALSLLRERRFEDVDRLLGDIVGDGCSLAGLGVHVTARATPGL
jgi:precorrin-2 dehydrogenase/sirohydrochlorin ferrochelatase